MFGGVGDRVSRHLRGNGPLTATVSAGLATIRYEFAYDGRKPGSWGTGRIYVNGKKVAEGQTEHTKANIFSADETADVGFDEATPVTENYKERDNEFTGKIYKVTVKIGETALSKEGQKTLEEEKFESEMSID